MTLSVPPRSLPPPMLPPKVVAQTRIKALDADLAVETRPVAQAALAYEMGALTELRLHDPQAATQRYEAAHAYAPGFRPPLFALARQLRERGEHVALAHALEAIVAASPTASERASVLTELAALQCDELNEPSVGHATLEAALSEDPTAPAALLSLESEQRPSAERGALAELLARRAAAAEDPSLRSLLLCESADLLASAGDTDAAVQQLVRASALPARRSNALLQLFRLARASGRHAIAAGAASDLATLLQRSVEAGTSQPGHQPPDDAIRELLASLPQAQERKRLAGLYFREAGRALLVLGEDPAAATLAYASASECSPAERLITTERLEACELAQDLDTARELARGLLEGADPARASALHFQLAETAERQGDRNAARAELRAALALVPGTPAALAVLEDALLDDGDYAELCDHLEARAELAGGAERQLLLTRAASVAADLVGDAARATLLYARLIDEAAGSDSPEPFALRELFGIGLRFQDPTLLARAAGLLVQLATDEQERSAYVRAQYRALLAAGDIETARALLQSAQADGSCDDWAPQLLRVTCALQHDFGWLAHAHDKLARLAQNVDAAAAHACAQARAWLRGGDSDAAVACLRNALELSPANAYAVALLEDVLIARGETAEAVHLLREAAAAEQNARASELSLLHAGAAAEAAGQTELAARAYEEAIDRDNTALSPLWTLRRLGERLGEPQFFLAALEGLALRESAAGLAGVCNVELAERYDTLAKPELAMAPLEAALDGNVAAFEAAVALVLLPRNPFDAELRPRALQQLTAALNRQARADVEREHSAELLLATPELARGALDVLLTNEPAVHGDALLRLLCCRDGAERSLAFATLARLSNDLEARAQLRLQAVRGASYERRAAADDALVSALGALEQAPGSLAAALALDEALATGDAPDAHVHALRARLPHTTPAGKLSTSAALARALEAAGEHGQAVDWARAVLEADPSDVGVWETLRVGARATGDFETVVLACDTLAFHADGEARALLLEEAAVVLEEQLARPADAELRLHAALLADETRSSCFERLHDLLLERRDLEGVSSLLSARVRVAASEDERLDLLYEQARVLRALGERQATLACLDEVLTALPDHVGALGLAAETHASEKSWAGAVAALRALAGANLPTSQEKLARQGAADFLERNLGDNAGAYHELAALAARGLAEAATWQRMGTLAQRAQLWPQAVEALTEAAQLTSGEECATLERAAGEVLELKLRRRDEASDAYRRALAAWPTDVSSCERLAALLDAPQARQQLVAAVIAALLDALARAPGQDTLLRELIRAAKLADDALIEHTALETLAVLGVASEPELDALAELDRRLPTQPSGVLSDAEFAQLRVAPSDANAARCATLLCKAWLDDKADSPAQHGVDRHGRVKKQSEHPVRNALSAFCSAFGLGVSDFYVGGGQPRALTMVATPGHLQPWVIGSAINEHFDAPLRFRIGQQLTGMRDQLLPLTLGARSEASDLLLAGLLTVGNETADSERLRPLAKRLSDRLPRAARRELEQKLAELGNPVSALQAVTDAARQSATRGGMVACGSLRTALSLTLAERFDARSIAADPTALALLRFWCSGSCIALRRKLGLAP